MEPSFYEFMDLFEKNITVEYIASELDCWNTNMETKEQAIKRMIKNEFDLIGIDDNGERCRCLNIKGEIREIDIKGIISESTPLTYITQLFYDNLDRKLFILKRKTLDGIVTKADLQKGPYCLFLFGLVTNLEITCLKFIDKFCKDNWEEKISQTRYDKIREEYEKSSKEQSELNLLFYTYLTDKKVILFKINEFSELYKEINLSKTKARRFFSRIIRLRNNLVHSKRINENFKDWRDLLETIRFIPLITSKMRGFLSD
ncbi:MAG: hypothetical protein P8Y97_07835 [Candidatus Lokiarchaeota archaeon]